MTAVYDPFTGTTALSSAWTNLLGAASCVGGVLTPSSAPFAYYRNDYTPNANQQVEIAYQAAASDGNMAFRLNLANFNGYALLIESNRALVARLDAGAIGLTFAEALAPGGTFSAGDRIKARVVGTAFSVYINDVLISTGTETTYSAAGVMTIGGSATGDTIQSWQGSDVADVSASAGLGVVSYAGFAPTITVGGGSKTASTGLGALAFTGFAPNANVSNNIVASAGVAALAYTGFVPTITASDNKVVGAGLGAVAYAGFAPTVTASNNQSVSAGLGALVFTGFAPTTTIGAGHRIYSRLFSKLYHGVGVNKTVSTGLGALTYTAFAPTITVAFSTVAHPGVGALAYAGFAPIVIVGRTQGVRYGFNTFQPPYGSAAATNIIAELQAIGVRDFRTGLTWNNMQTTNGGSIDYTNCNNAKAIADALGQKALFVVEGTPSWANPGTQSLSIGGKYLPAEVPIYGTSNWTAFLAFHTTWANTQAAKWKDTVDWEIGNEWLTPGSGFWIPGGDPFAAIPDVDQYIQAFFEWFMVYYTAIRAVAPKAKICIGSPTDLAKWYGSNGIAGLIGIPKFLDLLDAAGVRPDALGIHPYCSPLTGGAAVTRNPNVDNYPNANSYRADVDRVRTMMITKGWGTCELWLTEWGWHPQSEASWVTDEFSIIRDNWGPTIVGNTNAPVTRAYYYTLRNTTDSGGTTDLDDKGAYTGAPWAGPNTEQAVGARIRTFIALFSQNTSVSTGLGQVVYTGYAPTAGQGRRIFGRVFSKLFKRRKGKIFSRLFGRVYNTPYVHVSTGLGQMVYAGFAPTIGISNNKTVAAGVGAVAYAGFAPSLSFSNNKIASAGVGSVLYTGYAPTTGALTSYMGTTAVPIERDVPQEVLTDAALRALIKAGMGLINGDASKDGTGDSSAFYSDSSSPIGGADGRSIVLGTGPFGEAVYEDTVYGKNVGDQSPGPQLIHTIPSGKRTARMWVGRRLRHQQGWSNVGDATSSDGIAWNAGEGKGWKTGPWLSPNNISEGRSGVDMEDTAYNIASGVRASPNSYGLIDSRDRYVVNEFTDGLYYDEMWLFESYLGADGTCWMVMTGWRKLATDPNSSYTRFGPRLGASTGTDGTALIAAAQAGDPVVKYNTIQWTNKNYNQSRSTNLKRQIAYQAWWDANNPNHDGSDDPHGCLARDAAQTPRTPYSIAQAGTVMGTTATFDVQLTSGYPVYEPSYARKLRPVINGVDVPAQDFTIAPYVAEGPADNTPTQYDALTAAGKVRVTLILPIGTNTVAFKSVNGVGSGVSTASNTITGIVVTAIATSTGSLVYTGLAPAVTTGGNKIASTGAGALQYTGFAPTAVGVSGNRTVLPGVGALVYTAYAPTITVSDNKVARVDVGALQFVGFAPSINLSNVVTVSVGTGTLLYIGYSPAVAATQNKAVQADVGALLYVAFAPTVTSSNQQRVTPGTGAMVYLAFAPTVTGGGVVAIDLRAVLYVIEAIRSTLFVDGGIVVDLNLLPGQTYKFAICLTRRDDPTGADVPAAGESPALVFADATIGEDDDVTTFGFLRIPADVNSSTFTLPDGTPAQKYLATLAGSVSRAPLLARAGQVIYVYVQDGTDLLEPRTARVVKVPGVRRFSSYDG